MTPLLIDAAILAALLVWARREYRLQLAREAMDAALSRRLDAQCAAITRGLQDDHACECCHAAAPVRELVTLHDDATLACPACAALLMGRGAHG